MSLQIKDGNLETVSVSDANTSLTEFRKLAFDARKLRERVWKASPPKNTDMKKLNQARRSADTLMRELKSVIEDVISAEKDMETAG